MRTAVTRPVLARPPLKSQATGFKVRWNPSRMCKQHSVICPPIHTCISFSPSLSCLRPFISTYTHGRYYGAKSNTSVSIFLYRCAPKSPNRPPAALCYVTATAYLAGKMTEGTASKPAASPSTSFYDLSDDEEGDYNTIRHTSSGRGVKLLYTKSKVCIARWEGGNTLS